MTILALAGCGSQHDSTSGQRSSPNPATATQTAPSPTIVRVPDGPADAKGIIAFTLDGAKCSSHAIDLQSGAVRDIATFYTNRAGAAVICPTKPSDAPTQFSPDFQRASVVEKKGNTEVAGWIDYHGNFTAISPPSEEPDFGPRIVVSAFGFDKKGNYYYGVGDGDKLQEYFKVNAGTVGPGESIGRTTEGNLFNEVGLGLIPGGELGLTKSASLNANLYGNGASCERHQNLDGTLDPDRSTYFFTADGRVFKGRYCASTNAGDATPITPPSNNALGDVLSNPDGTQVLFQMSGGKVFLVDADGTTPPRQITGFAADFLAKATLYRWQ